RRSAPDVRYVVASIGLALMLTLPIVTGVQRYQALSAETGSAALAGEFRLKAEATGVETKEADAPPRATTELGTLATAVAGAVPAGFLTRVRSLRLEGFLPLLMPVWLAGVSLLSLRLFTGWLWVQRLRTRGVGPADAALRGMASARAAAAHRARRDAARIA